MQYFDLVGQVCDSAFTKKPVERRIPMSAGTEEQHRVMEDRKKVLGLQYHCNTAVYKE